ncbi:HYR domain-containing protein, partial [Christiangramia flava]
ATCSFEIKVVDDEDPTISCPGDITDINDEGVCGAVVTFATPDASDNSGNVTVEQVAGPASGEVFPVGTTTVTFRATDDDDNFVECSFDVTITDNEAPEITCPADIEITTEDGLCGVSLANLDLGMATASDNCEGEITITNNAPTTFPLGTTEVTWTATDTNGNSATCVQKVTVSDDEAPVVTQIENYTDIDTDPETCGAVINYGTIQATDNCEIESIEMTEGIASGQVFPVGTTTVTYVVTDASGNQSTMTFTVTVVDNEDPMITCPGNIEVSTAEGENFAVVTFEDATATDNCEVTVTQTGGQASGSEFGPGVHTIEYTATDASGNTAVCSFTITVEDDEDPTITCPENIVQPNDPGLCGAAVEFAMPEFADNSGQVTIEQLTGPASGEFFEVGTTTVTFRATDAAGNTAECSFDVTVNDTEAPTTETMENITVNAEQEFCGAVVDFGMIGADDNCGLESVEITEGLASGEVFPVGTTTVTWTVTDIHGNTTTVSFDVTVVDNTNPIISCPGDMVVPTAEGDDSVVVNFNDATATDNCDVTVEQTAGPTSGSDLTIGFYTVEYTATDASGNTAVCSFNITVTDGEPPVINCPGDISQNVDAGVCGAVVTFATPDASDNSGSVTVEQVAGPASGSVFPVGTTTVTFRATDDDDNFVECSFDVTITDNEAPEITCPADIEITTEDGLCGVSLANLDLGMATAADNCEGEITITNNAPTTFPLGTTEVTWTATDANGNSATCVQNVTVSDDEAPVVTQIENYTDIDTDPETCGAVINYGTIQATDNCEIESIEMTEGIASGQVFPVGTTTVTYVVTDASGNQSTMTFTVTVVDNEDPMITCPGNIEVSTAEGENFAVVTFEDATATDNCEVTVTQTSGQASGSEFGPGVHTIEYTATDASGNTAVCSFTITVEDDEDPTITCPENIVQPNDPGLCGAVVEFAMPEFADNSGQVTIEQLTGPASGEFFEVGTTTVTFRATDAAGNTAECSFDVTVNDTEAPTTETMENITVNAEQEFCGAVVDFGMIGADDNCGLESVEITEGLASGEVFPVGTTTVTWTVTDIHGNTATVSFDVTVVDNTNPIISCPGDMTVTTATGQNYAIVEFADATATDNCDVTVEQTAGPLSGSQFPIGDTTVTFTATDNSGNTAECSFTVTVEDGEDPSISCPENIVTPNDPGICGA